MGILEFIFGFSKKEKPATNPIIIQKAPKKADVVSKKEKELLDKIRKNIEEQRTERSWHNFKNAKEEMYELEAKISDKKGENKTSFKDYATNSFVVPL